jgi:polyhydroxyalkanoate synthesis regulator phasin
MEKTKTITNQDDLSAYYQDLVDKGILTNEQAIELFNAYMPEAESPTTDELWEVVDDGGVNWGWGIDNNAKVKDRSGNTYTLKALKEKLINEGMTEKEATEYVKNLQKELGI